VGLLFYRALSGPKSKTLSRLWREGTVAVQLYAKCYRVEIYGVEVERASTLETMPTQVDAR